MLSYGGYPDERAFATAVNGNELTVEHTTLRMNEYIQNNGERKQRQYDQTAIFDEVEVGNVEKQNIQNVCLCSG